MTTHAKLLKTVKDELAQVSRKRMMSDDERWSEREDYLETLHELLYLHHDWDACSDRTGAVCDTYLLVVVALEKMGITNEAV